jgi:hypothetical protein
MYMHVFFSATQRDRMEYRTNTYIHMVQYNTIQYNTMQYNTTQHNTTQHETIQIQQVNEMETRASERAHRMLVNPNFGARSLNKFFDMEHADPLEDKEDDDDTDKENAQGGEGEREGVTTRGIRFSQTGAPDVSTSDGGSSMYVHNKASLDTHNDDYLIRKRALAEQKRAKNFVRMHVRSMNEQRGKVCVCVCM